jgi:H+/Cl- antiporter ClcA
MAATVLPAAVCSAVVVVTSWLVLPRHAIYRIASLHLTGSVLVFAVLVGPVVGLVAVGFNAVVSSSRARAPAQTGRLLIASLVSFGALGSAAIAYPQLLGNCKGRPSWR